MVENKEEDEHGDNIKTPKILLNKIKSGEFDPDPLAINYKLKRMIYDPEIDCDDFNLLFEELLSILEPRNLFELTQVLYPEFCNWVEMLLSNSAITKFTTEEFYKFHNEILTDLSEETCIPCMANIDNIWDDFYDEADRRYREENLTKSEEIQITSLLKYHDELGELMISHKNDNIKFEKNENNLKKYLKLVNLEKIMDPIVKREVKELIQEYEW